MNNHSLLKIIRLFSYATAFIGGYQKSVEETMEYKKILDESNRIPDVIWEKIEPLLPPELPRSKGGRPPMDNHKAMEAIFYVFRTGCGWKRLPRNLGAGSTVYHRFQKWRKAGVFERLWQAGLLQYDELRAIFWHGK